MRTNSKSKNSDGITRHLSTLDDGIFGTGSKGGQSKPERTKTTRSEHRMEKLYVYMWGIIPGNSQFTRVRVEEGTSLERLFEVVFPGDVPEYKKTVVCWLGPTSTEPSGNLYQTVNLKVQKDMDKLIKRALEGKDDPEKRVWFRAQTDADFEESAEESA